MEIAWGFFVARFAQQAVPVRSRVLAYVRLRGTGLRSYSVNVGAGEVQVLLESLIA